MNKLKIYAVWTGAKDEAARCVAVLETGERIDKVDAINEDAARAFVDEGYMNDTFTATIHKRSTPSGPNADESFHEEHGVTYDGWELEFVGEADRSRYPQITALLGLM